LKLKLLIIFIQICYRVIWVFFGVSTYSKGILRFMKRIEKIKARTFRTL
jgi:hypothetical protein